MLLLLHFALTPALLSLLTGPNKVFCGGIPYSLQDQEVIELLQTFGPLRAFHLIKDPGSATSKGYAFFEYADPDHTDPAIAGLNGMQLLDKQLTLRRASPKGTEHPASNQPAQAGVAAVNPLVGAPGAVLPTRILVLTNMVEPTELTDDNEYKEIYQDIKDECGTYGQLLRLTLPRPGQPGVGRAFLEYASVADAVRAFGEVNGRAFGDRLVVASYLPEDRYAAGAFE